MGRCLPILLIAFLMFPSFGFGAPTEAELADFANVPKAVFRLENVCEFTLYTKKSSSGFIKRVSSFFGNGFFIEHTGETHLALSAGHVVDCGGELQEGVFDERVQKADVTSFEIKNLATFAIFGEVRFPVNVLEKGPNGLGSLDIAVLGVILPKGFEHYHLPVLKQKNIYMARSEIFVYGFQPSIGKWRLKTGIIEAVSEAVIEISILAYSGMSGSPVLYWDGKKHVVIGVLFGGWASARDGVIDSSLATSFTDKVIAEIEKRAASK